MKITRAKSWPVPGSAAFPRQGAGPSRLMQVRAGESSPWKSRIPLLTPAKQRRSRNAVSGDPAKVTSGSVAAAVIGNAVIGKAARPRSLRPYLRGSSGRADALPDRRGYVWAPLRARAHRRLDSLWPCYLWKDSTVRRSPSRRSASDLGIGALWIDSGLVATPTVKVRQSCFKGDRVVTAGRVDAGMNDPFLKQDVLAGKVCSLVICSERWARNFLETVATSEHIAGNRDTVNRYVRFTKHSVLNAHTAEGLDRFQRSPASMARRWRRPARFSRRG